MSINDGTMPTRVDPGAVRRVGGARGQAQHPLGGGVELHVSQVHDGGWVVGGAHRPKHDNAGQGDIEQGLKQAIGRGGGCGGSNGKHRRTNRGETVGIEPWNAHEVAT